MEKKNKILAVDDNPVNLAVIQELLECQYYLKTVSTGLEALETARQFRPELIILDIMLPDIDGYEVCQKIRNSSTLRNTKIIIVSAKAMISEQRRGYQVGADDYLTKPFDGEELLEKICDHLNSKTVNTIQQNK